MLLVFKISESLKHIFKLLRSGLVYKYKRSGCNVTYYSKTNCHFKARICEHIVTSYLTEKKVKTDNNKLTGIQEHLLCSNYTPSFEVFSILTTESNDFKLKITDRLLTELDKPMLKHLDTLLPLGLF